MAVAAPAFTGFRPEADPVPRRPRREQRAGLVPAAQGRVRAAAQGAARGACVALDERVRARGIPLRADPGAVAVPDLPRRPLLEGQVAVQDERRRRASPGSARAPSDGVGRSHTETSTRSGGYFHLQPGEIYVGGGDLAPGEAVARRRSGGACVDEPAEFRRARRRARVQARRSARSAATASRSSASRRASRRPSGRRAAQAEGRDVRPAAGRQGRDVSPKLPDVIADTFEAALPVMRYLAAVG